MIRVKQSMNIRAYLDKHPHIADRVWVDPTAVVIGDVEIGTDSSVWPYAVIRGDMHHIRIGERTSVQDGSVLHITHSSDFNPGGFPLVIGDDVTIGHQAMLHGCTIGSRILIGMKACIMDGAVVEDEVIVGAAALVTPGMKLASGYVYAGSPARKIRAITEKEREFFRYSAQNYVRLKDDYMA